MMWYDMHQQINTQPMNHFVLSGTEAT